MSNPGPAIAAVLENEGSGYCEDDYGRGPSRYGITLKTYQQFFPSATALDIVNMDPESAAAFYKTNFWTKYNIYAIDDQTLANKVLDLAVLDGPETSIKWLQNAVGAVPDGILGPETMKKMWAIQDPAAVLARIRAQASTHYRQVVVQNPQKSKELAGWMARLAKPSGATPT